MTKHAILMSGHFRSFEQCVNEFEIYFPFADFYGFLLKNENSYEEEKMEKVVIN
tara:strand:- start:886 stop:1047 length:162 start_codon:yes stop_codon:yes gene_type:complete